MNYYKYKAKALITRANPLGFNGDHIAIKAFFKVLAAPWNGIGNYSFLFVFRMEWNGYAN
jgi:hypothetical protein